MTASLFERPVKVKAVEPETTERVLRGMIARSSNGVLMMPPGVAQRILDDLNFPEQRPVKEHRVLEHLAKIQSGSWRTFAISFVVMPDGRIWMVDGQHRLNAIVRSGGSQPVRVLLDEVPNEQEARRRYVGFDQKSSIRTDAEVLDAVGISELLKVKRFTAIALYRALPLLLNNFEPVRGPSERNLRARSDVVRLSEIENWVSEVGQYEVILGFAHEGLRKKMVNAGCMAVALYTLRHQPARAKEFWGGLAKNDGLKRVDPRAVLIADMQNRSLNVGTSRQTMQQPAVAWNAWNEGRELRIIKCLDGAPVTLWGTPLAKGRA